MRIGRKTRVFPSAPQGQRKKTRVFLRAMNGSEETLVCRRKSQAIFDDRRRVPRKLIEFSGDRVPSDSKGIGGDDGKKIEEGVRSEII